MFTACHARTRTAEETDWPRIAALYESLAQIAPSPIVDLNRAAALTRNARERTLLLGAECQTGTASR